MHKSRNLHLSRLEGVVVGVAKLIPFVFLSNAMKSWGGGEVGIFTVESPDKNFGSTAGDTYV